MGSVNFKNMSSDYFSETSWFYHYIKKNTAFVMHEALKKCLPLPSRAFLKDLRIES